MTTTQLIEEAQALSARLPEIKTTTAKEIVEEYQIEISRKKNEIKKAEIEISREMDRLKADKKLLALAKDVLSTDKEEIMHVLYALIEEKKLATYNPHAGN